MLRPGSLVLAENHALPAPSSPELNAMPPPSYRYTCAVSEQMHSSPGEVWHLMATEAHGTATGHGRYGTDHLVW